MVSVFKEARKLWMNYLSIDHRKVVEKELQILGWDPFACKLGEVEKATLETFIGYLESEKMIARKLTYEKLFHKYDKWL